MEKIIFNIVFITCIVMALDMLYDIAIFLLDILF